MSTKTNIPIIFGLYHSASNECSWDSSGFLNYKFTERNKMGCSQGYCIYIPKGN